MMIIYLNYSCLPDKYQRAETFQPRLSVHCSLPYYLLLVYCKSASTSMRRSAICAN